MRKPYRTIQAPVQAVLPGNDLSGTLTKREMGYALPLTCDGSTPLTLSDGAHASSTA